jgi:hypothetical protein
MHLTDYLKTVPLIVMAATLAACGGDPEPASDVATPPAATNDAGSTATDAAPPAKAQVSYDCPDDEPTMIDICLGLTPEQVAAALEKHSPGLEIRQNQTTFNYTDGAQQLRTDPFVSQIGAEDGIKDEYFRFVFTGPPGEGRLTHMTRGMGSAANLPPIEPLIAGLIKNYGEPAFRYRGVYGGANIATLRWDFPQGRVLCGGPPQQDNGLVMMDGGLTPGVDIDGMIARLSSQGIADPARCTGWLQVYIQTFDDNEPVRSVEMKLTDLAGALAGGLATYAWLEETEAKARADRLEAAEMPDL